MDSSLAPYRGYLAMTIVVFIIVLAGTVFILRRPEPVPVTITTPTPRGTPTRGVVVIQVCGAVANSGVYTLPEGSRVQDALKRAGDALTSGDTSVLNLARKLNDGEQICVPSISDGTSAASAPTPLATLKSTSACISNKDVSSHIGEITCVRGTVSSTGKSGATFFINFDTAGDSFYAVSFNHTWDSLSGKCVEIKGKLVPFRGRPEIIIDDESQLSFCK